MNKVLFVIDYINGIVHTGTCADYLKAHPEVIANTNKLIAQFRQLKLPVFFIRLGFNESYFGLPKYAPTAKYIKENNKFLLNTSETEFISALDFNSNDLVFNKKYGDPFYGSDILIKLAKLEIEQIIFTGVATDNAILNGASTAIVNNFKVTIIKDACAAPAQQQHENALAIMQGRTASEILTTAELLMQL